MKKKPKTVLQMFADWLAINDQKKVQVFVSKEAFVIKSFPKPKKP